MAWGMPFSAILNGAAIIFPSSHLQTDPIIEIMINEKITKAIGIPTIWQGIYETLKKNNKASLLRLKEFNVGGASAPPTFIENFQNEFGIKTVHAWGMSETSPVVTVSKLLPEHDSLQESEKIKIRSFQGQELPGVEIRIVAEDGNIAPRDGKTVGEVQVRGAWIIDAYYKTNSNEVLVKMGG